MKRGEREEDVNSANCAVYYSLSSFQTFKNALSSFFYKNWWKNCVSCLDLCDTAPGNTSQCKSPDTEKDMKTNSPK